MRQWPTAAPAAALACALAVGGLAGCGAGDVPLPPAPAGLTAQAGSATSVHVMWDAATGGGGARVTGYQVFQGGTLVRELPAEKTMVDITGLAPQTAYAFTVRAKAASGALSAPSAEATATTPAARPEDRQAPTAPGTLSARAEGPRAVRLTWSPASDDVGVTAYDVHQGGVRIHTVTGTETATLLTGLRPDTVYTFTVRARDGADNSSPDGPAADATTPPAAGRGPSTAPADLTAAVSPGTVTLSWDPPDTGRPTTEYELHIDGRPTTTVQFGAGAVPAGRAEYRLTVTEPAGTVWALKLRARLPDGTWGAFSAERRVTLMAGS
ncbi:fibronectin type III domain-containing protein [Streptomyces sp. WAC06614]|uniref:fibronectin type III domain-containing protein n=1 Tax=Streptomyces sp. WAC06614 TaxID=2487416 RepID=UPI000F77D08F|nr:fibronectin type III domain-containing protein [Streptomyces sp. WAC06614]RSS83114.1 fibronectin type III domain-containing protein [Streptomyces sp. WAC06614]